MILAALSWLIVLVDLLRRSGEFKLDVCWDYLLLLDMMLNLTSCSKLAVEWRIRFENEFCFFLSVSVIYCFSLRELSMRGGNGNGRLGKMRWPVPLSLSCLRLSFGACTALKTEFDFRWILIALCPSWSFDFCSSVCLKLSASCATYSNSSNNSVHLRLELC